MNDQTINQGGKKVKIDYWKLTSKEDFVNYVFSFYGKLGQNLSGVFDEGIYVNEEWCRGGFTVEEVSNAVDKYIQSIDASENAFSTWGDGDSLDRERVRDILVGTPEAECL